MRKTYRIICPRTIIESFKRVALDHHPREAYAVLFGRIEGMTAEIKDIWYPEDQWQFATANEVETVSGRPAWWQKAVDIAESEGLDIIGDIHSHPETDPARLEDPSPSYSDWQTFPGPNWIRGICVVCKRPRSVRFRVTFWPPLVRVVVKYV